MIDIGTRIGAIYSMSKTEAKLIGYGKYVAYGTPGSDATGNAAVLRDHGFPDHKFILDGGEMVYGCEIARWALEDVVKSKLKQLSVTNVNVRGEPRNGI